MSKNIDQKNIARIVGCRSDFELGELLGDFEVDGVKGFTSLKTAPDDLDAKAKRYELIETVRGGKHVELKVTARTFRQQDKVQNRRFLRLGGDLAAQVVTFAKQPFIVDHNTYQQDSRKGTILNAKLVEETQKRIAFEMAFLAVKPDAVISFLDGTMDRFSVAWYRLGPVLCTAHNVDISLRDSCSCWPGDQVVVDGKNLTAEYLFTKWGGKELSGTNFPAVEYTNIEDMRSALAAELDLPQIRRPRPTNQEKKTTMRFPNVQQALGLVLTDEPTEEAMLTAVTALKTRATTAEAQLAEAKAKLAQAETALAATSAASKKVQVDDILQRLGYSVGKLKLEADPTDPEKRLPSPMEGWLRSLADQKGGLELLKTQLGLMPVIVPVGKRLQSESVLSPPTQTELAAGDDAGLLSEDNPYLVEACADAGFDIKSVISFANTPSLFNEE